MYEWRKNLSKILTSKIWTKQNVKKPYISEDNKKKPKDRIIRDIWNIFGTEQEKKKGRN